MEGNNKDEREINEKKNESKRISIKKRLITTGKHLISLIKKGEGTANQYQELNRGYHYRPYRHPI